MVTKSHILLLSLLFLFILHFFKSRLVSQHGAWTHDPEIRSDMLYQLSRPGYLHILFLNLTLLNCISLYTHTLVDATQLPPHTSFLANISKYASRVCSNILFLINHLLPIWAPLISPSFTSSDFIHTYHVECRMNSTCHFDELA